jgi:hypothetical protein
MGTTRAGHGVHKGIGAGVTQNHTHSTEVERSPLDDPDETRRYRSVVALQWFTAVLGVLSLIVTAIGGLNIATGGDSSTGFYLFATAMFVPSGVWLIIEANQLHRYPARFRRLQISAALVAGGSLYAGCFVTLPFLEEEVSSEIDRSIRMAQPPTEEETTYTPLEFEPIAVAAFEDALAALTDTVPTGEDLVFYDGSCLTSNLDEGWLYGAEAWVDVALLDPEFESAAVDGWKELGYTDHPSPDVWPWTGPLITVESSYVDQLALIQPNSDRVLVTFETICVLGTNPLRDDPTERGPNSDYWTTHGPFAGE